MWEMIHTWIEQHSGVTYDVGEFIEKMSGNSMIVEPKIWYNNLSILLDVLNQMVDVIDEYGDLVPDDMPNKIEMKRFITSETLFSLVQIVNHVKEKLGIDQIDIRSFSVLEKHCDVLTDLITVLSENKIEDIIKNDWFEEYDEESNGFLTTVFGLSIHDLSSIVMTINDVVELDSDID